MPAAEETGPLPAGALERLMDWLGCNLSRFDAVLVSDYAKGMVSESTMQTLLSVVANA